MLTTESDGRTYTLTVQRRYGQLTASTAPGRLRRNGNLRTRHHGSSRTAGAQAIGRNTT
ncbi:hypothetical protein [Streptomyces rubiginosohelvolus]|uniref:Uncharacterized protein n=1 Tax=Streptomyces rubiginosohelvolus TaxID=67362 RepID=A0ABW6ESR4_9ACTN